MDKSEKKKCEKCGSGFGYLRRKDYVWVCRTCGALHKIKKEEEDPQDA